MVCRYGQSISIFHYSNLCQVTTRSKPPIGRASQKAATLKFDTKLSNCDKCRPEIAGDVTSGVAWALERVGMDVGRQSFNSVMRTSRLLQQA